MNITLEEIMTSQVLTTQRHQSAEHVRDLMAKNGINALPVVDSEGEAVGIVTTTDLVDGVAPGSKVSSIMSKNVVTMPSYGEPRVAARTMRNQGFHHIIVTHEKKVVGIVSTFDLLRLVEEHRFVAKGATRTGMPRWTKRQKKPVSE
jgi:CBS domain-containing protein